MSATTGRKTERQVRDEFRSAVNMTARRLEAWLETPESKAVGWRRRPGAESVGHASGRRIVQILRTKQADLTEEDLDHMRKVVGYVRRHRAQWPSGDVSNRPWRYSLMNWGHDPLTPPKGSPGDLVAFHARNKYAILARSPQAYAELGRLVARAGSRPMRESIKAYAETYSAAMRVEATPGRHANVLQHLAGMLKHRIDAKDRSALTTAIERFRDGLVPWGVPVGLLRRHLRQHDLRWALQQTYLDGAGGTTRASG